MGLVVFLLLFPANAHSNQNLTGTYGAWVAEMKTAPRGPFKQIRWFCNDGTVHPPRPYPCAERGGGRQHGEWTDRVKRIRADGYAIANVLADIDPGEFLGLESHPFLLKQILLEQFLIRSDDGWIFRRARYYRGALQAENEMAVASQILRLLAGESRWKARNFFVLREAARMLHHDSRAGTGVEIRQLSRTIEEGDPGFASLRIKIHVKPDQSDAATVRRYAAGKGRTGLSDDYARLAELIDRFYHPRDLAADLKRLARKSADPLFSALALRSAPAFETGGGSPKPGARTWFWPCWMPALRWSSR